MNPKIKERITNLKLSQDLDVIGFCGENYSGYRTLSDLLGMADRSDVNHWVYNNWTYEEMVDHNDSFEEEHKVYDCRDLIKEIGNLLEGDEELRLLITKDGLSVVGFDAEGEPQDVLGTALFKLVQYKQDRPISEVKE